MKTNENTQRYHSYRGLPTLAGLATIDQAASAPLLLTLAGDLREELPVLFLRLREGLKKSTKLIEIAPAPTALSAFADAVLAIRPGDAPVVAKALTGDDAAATSLGSHHEGNALADGALDAARALLAEHPGGDGVVEFFRTVQRGADIWLDRPYQRRPRGLECGNEFQPEGGVELQPQRAP